jgi:acetoin utilization deacetylase AcuC-like enzyme
MHLRDASRRLARAARARLGPARGYVVHHPEYRAPANGFVDPERAEKILGHLFEHGCVTSRQVHAPEPLPVASLARVHDFAYLESLGAPGSLERIFPHGAADVDLQGMLRQQRRMTAGTVLAARLALDERRPVANLGGGFHHAHRAHGEGFCIFNDVAVAVAELRAGGFAGRVLVVDTDVHPGNGTREIFAADPTVFTFSIHAREWSPCAAIADLDVELGTAAGDRAYLDTLAATLPSFCRDADPAIVFYVAGVDVADDDHMGTLRLTSDAILKRDRMVVELAGGRPLVWTLAGGYGPDAWRHTARSLAWLFAGLEDPIPSEAERALRRYRRIKDRLPVADLTGEPEEPWRITAEDVFGDLVGKAPPPRLLGFYSEYGVETAFERYGVLDCVRKTGVPRLRVTLDMRHATGPLARVTSDDARRDVFIEIVLRESNKLPPFRLLSLEWLLLQNPRARPTPERPLLPGQEHPGLGCLSTVMLMLVMACERLGFDGLLFTPSKYHVAAIARGLLRFVQPEREAAFLAITEALQGYGLGEASRLVHQGAVFDTATGEPYEWTAAEMVLPVSDAMKAHFAREEHQRGIEATAKTMRLRLAPQGAGAST